MAWAALLLALLSHCSGISSQATVTQPASASVSPGDTMKLSCTRSSGGSWNDFRWYQQKPGQVPRYVHRAGQSRGEGIPDRFTASQSGNTGHLTIANVEAGDEGDYYCCGWYSTGSVYVFGGGTQLTVSGQPRVPPNVHVFGPSEEEKKTKAKATITCLMDGFYPGDATVEWLVDGTPVSSGVETARPTRQGDKYVASSYLTLPVSEWEKHETYACKVTHGGEATEKSVRRSEYR